MFDFIPQIIILVALVIIIVIIIKRFPEASEYNKEKAGDNKEDTFSKRVLSVLRYLGKRIKIFSVSIAKSISSMIKKARSKEDKPQKEQKNKGDSVSELVENKPDLMQKEEDLDVEKEKNEDEIIDLLENAAESLGSGYYQRAEDKYIEVIKKDSKNIRAYKGLGKVYFKQNNFKDAKASYEQVLKLNPEDNEAQKEIEVIVKEESNVVSEDK